jgi:mono/diheme cytochrome c family protein
MRWMILSWFVALALLAARSPGVAQPADGDPASGRQIATRLCSSCHHVLPISLPDKADAPSFQSIADLPSTTGISLYVFLHSNHRNMPDLIVSSAESNDLIAYILSLKKK